MENLNLIREYSNLNTRIHREISKLDLSDFGLEKDRMSRANIGIILYIYSHKDKNVFQKDLEEAFSVRRSTISSVLSLMEEKNFIRREDVKYDKRLKKLVLTDKSICLAKTLKKHRDDFESRITKDISESELLSFMETLKKIEKNIGGES